jgi:hypothetical protein
MGRQDAGELAPPYVSMVLKVDDTTTSLNAGDMRLWDRRIAITGDASDLYVRFLPMTPLDVLAWVGDGRRFLTAAFQEEQGLVRLDARTVEDIDATVRLSAHWNEGERSGSRHADVQGLY